jgi:hypothetical protein
MWRCRTFLPHFYQDSLKVRFLASGEPNLYDKLIYSSINGLIKERDTEKNRYSDSSFFTKKRLHVTKQNFKLVTLCRIEYSYKSTARQNDDWSQSTCNLICVVPRFPSLQPISGIQTYDSQNVSFISNSTEL